MCHQGMGTPTMVWAWPLYVDPCSSGGWSAPAATTQQETAWGWRKFGVLTSSLTATALQVLKVIKVPITKVRNTRYNMHLLHYIIDICHSRLIVSWLCFITIWGDERDDEGEIARDWLSCRKHTPLDTVGLLTLLGLQDKRMNLRCSDWTGRALRSSSLFLCLKQSSLAIATCEDSPLPTWKYLCLAQVARYQV